MKTHRKWLLMCIGFAVSCPALPTLAAAEPEALESAMDDESMLFMEIPSVYSASKYEQSVSDAPAWVTVITADEISRYGYRTLDDILESVPGFYVTNDRNYNYAGTRGFGRPGDYNSRLLLLLDGVRTNEALGGGASVGRELIVDVELIDRVEVTRGPGSALYGNNAFFGVINVITKRGRDLQALEVSGYKGTQDTSQGRITYGERFENTFEMLLSGTTFDSDGDDHINYPELDAPSVDVDDEEAENLFAKFNYRGLQLNAAYTSREKNVPTGSWQTINTDPRNKTKDKTYFANISYDHVFENNIEYSGDVYYERYEYDAGYVYDYAESPEDPPDIVVNQDWSKADWWGADGQVKFKQFERHTLILGGQYQDEFKLDQGNFDVYGIYLDDRRDSSNYGAYIQDEMLLRDDLTLYAGVRYDDYDSFGSTTNPRISLVYRFVPATTVKLIYGTAFRAPTAYEYYYHDDYETTKPPGDLDPEEIENYELILEQFVGNNFRVVASLYYYEIDDLIELTTDPQDELLVFTNNTDTITANGLELETEGKWEGGYKGRLSYTLQDTEDKSTGDSLSNSPKHLAKANLIVPLLKQRLLASLEIQYTSSRDAVRGEELDGYTITNLTLSAPNLWKSLDISASIYNAFDENYDDPGSEEHLQDGIQQDGREYRVNLTYRF